MGRDDAWDDMGPDSSDGDPTHSLELQIVADSFHAVTDGSVFDRLMENWDRRLSQASYGSDDAPGLGQLRRHYRVVEDLLGRLDAPPSLDAVDAVVLNSEAPTMVLTPDLRVMAINDAGRARFASEQGTQANLAWLDDDARKGLRDFARGQSGRGNRGYAVSRMVGDNSQVEQVEFFPLSGHEGNDPYFVARVLRLPWQVAMDSMLVEAFGLSEAEIDVARHLFEGYTVAQIALLRATSEGTVRNQIKSVFFKTEVNSQANLVRLLAMLSHRSQAMAGDSSMNWSDPFGREVTITDRHGRKVAYSWLGDPDGKPALLLHGIVNGFLYPPAFERALQDHGIKLFAPHRPGCGNSQRDPDLGLAKQIGESVLALCEQLGLTGIPVLTVSSVTVPAILLAASPANPFSAVIATGRFLPFTKARLERMNRKTRTLIWAACHAPWLARVFARVAYRQIQQHGTDWYIKQSFETLPFDRMTAYHPDLLPLFRNACAFSFMQSPDPFFEDFSMRDLDVRKTIGDVGVPVHWVLGDVDIYRGERGRDLLDTQEEIDDFLSRNSLASFERIPLAGEMMIYQQPVAVVERLAQFL